MGKKKASTFVEDISNSPGEIREVVAEGARHAADVVRDRRGSVIPRVVVLSVLLLGLGLGIVAARRRA